MYRHLAHRLEFDLRLVDYLILFWGKQFLGQTIL